MSAGWYIMSPEAGQKVTTMQPDPQPDDARATGELLHPSYWLVYGLPWQGDGDLAEAAAAIAPGMIVRDWLSRDASQILGCADLYARKHGSRVIFFSDLTRMFSAAGTSWAQLGIDWETALQELQDGPFPALLLTISERAHIFICSPATRLLLAGPDGEEEATDAERQLVRQAIASKLTTDWPPYMQQLIDTGRIRLAG
jgi:hypothetical protein